jgi:hypothetical protein
MMYALADVLRSIEAKWGPADAAKAWKKTDPEHRKVLKKYVGILLKELPDKDWPEGDKKILGTYAKGFQEFLKGL